GMGRGTEVLALDGVSVANLIASNGLDAALGPNEEGYTVEFEFVPAGADDSIVADIAKDEVRSTVVGTVDADLAPGIGYIYFRSFVNPAFSQLDNAFAEMKAAGVEKLIL